MSAFIDLHTHTRASDGADTPAQLVENAVRAGLAVFAVTDHDTIAGALAAAPLVPAGMRYLPGIEFTCISAGGKCHILGYGFDPDHPAFREALDTGHRLRLEKLERRLVYLKEQCGIHLTPEEIRQLRSEQSPGKPNLAKVLVNRGLAPDLNTAIRQYINPCKGGADRITAALAIDAITRAGGIPVWAHPLGGEGERRLTHAELEHRLAILMDEGIRGLECFYARYSAPDAAYLRDQARRHGLLVSGGSDYHGANKVGITLGQLSADGSAVDPGELTLLEHL